MHFPFSAIVGQPLLKRALLLSVIQPSLGGVLIRGTKGVAKTTTVRALAALLPPLATVAGCPFQRRPGETIAAWPLPADAEPITRPAPLVELPLGATEDRVLGTLHLEKALRGERAFEPGLLAAANRGILYIDEVNLLPDHLVDVLLDVAASGIHRLEREGLSLTHPARFVLIGTMNPEEGDLRPQLLDRFGLVVDLHDLADPAERAEAVRRRLAFESDPEEFARAWQPAEQALAAQIVEAQKLLPRVRVADELLEAISVRCLSAGAVGLRADLTVCRAACAWAALQGRTEVEPADVADVAELALAHRRTRPPQPPTDGPRRNDDCGTDNGEARGAKKSSATAGESPRLARSETLDQRRTENREGSMGSDSQLPSPASEVRFPIGGQFAVRAAPERSRLERSSQPGRWRAGGRASRGGGRGSPRPEYRPGARVAWADSIRAAALASLARGADVPRVSGVLSLGSQDLRFWPVRGPGGCLLLFVLDSSGSMAAWQRMKRTKAAVWSLLVQGYQKRDQVALLAFRNESAELVLTPTRRLELARQMLEALPVGGTTPLAHGLATAHRLIRQQRRRQPDLPIWAVLLTDGRGNVPVRSADPWEDSCRAARLLAASGAQFLVVDTEVGWPRFGGARQLAQLLAAPALSLDQALGQPSTARAG
jgi:magnesium chelatase subunit D